MCTIPGRSLCNSSSTHCCNFSEITAGIYTQQQVTCFSWQFNSIIPNWQKRIIHFWWPSWLYIKCTIIYTLAQKDISLSCFCNLLCSYWHGFYLSYVEMLISLMKLSVTFRGTGCQHLQGFELTCTQPYMNMPLRLLPISAVELLWSWVME